jgi:PAS domain S-box-containing protein
MQQDDRINLLLVDDQPAKLLSYEVILRDLGANLYKAASATEALQLLLKNEFAVVLIDVCMPELDGFELAAMIREHPRFSKVAIIFISAVLLNDADRLRGYEMGAVDYVPVPVIPEVLRAKVKVFAELYRKTCQLEQLNHDLEQRVAERTAELKSSNDRLQESEQQLRFATEAAEVGLWDVDNVADTLFWPPRVKAMFGISPDVSVTMADFFAGLHPEDKEAIGAAYAAACDPKQRALYDVEYRTVGREDGVIRWVAAKGRGMFDADGKCVRVLGTAIDITKRKQAEERQLLLAREVDHRARNALAVVQAIVRLTRSATVPNYIAAVEGRIRALAQAHTLLSQSRWEGADIARLVEEELAPYRVPGSPRINISGPPVFIEPDKAQIVALALHELATNSAKYGALSLPNAQLDLSWKHEPGLISLIWREAGGPPVRAPTEQGFGTKIINATVKHQSNGDVRFEWRPEGLVCTLVIPSKTSDGAALSDGSGATANNLVRLSNGGHKRVMLVEDETLVGMMMRDMLVELGLFVVGPICSVAEAHHALDGQQYDCAILDLNLNGEMVYPIADLLEHRGTPFAFVTGYGSESLDRRFAHIPLMQKPVVREMLATFVHSHFALGPEDAVSPTGIAMQMGRAGTATAS